MNRILKIFSALSDETRLRIFMLLINEELCVCEIENTLNMEQSRISRALKVLKDADLVKDRREGTWKYYSLNTEINEKNIVVGLKKDFKINKTDLRNLVKCKENNIRGKCKLNGR
jgi:ArsR family transcriptional regulator